MPLSVLAWAIALPPWSVSSLALVMLVPWLWALERAKKPGHAVIQGMWLSLGLGLVTLYPVAHALADYQDISWLTGIGGALLTALAFQLPLPVFAALRWWVGTQLRPRPLALAWTSAALFTGLDWLVPKPFNDTLGLIFYDDGWWRQSADLGGPWVLTFVVLVANETLVAFIRDARESRATLGATLSRNRRSLLVSGGLLALCLGYGALRSEQWSAAAAAAEDRLSVGIVQGSLPLAVKRAAEQGDHRAADEILSAYLMLSDELSQDPPRAPDLIVWPETTYPGIFRVPFNQRQAQRNAQLDLWVQRRQQALVFGSYDGESVPGGELRQYNAVFALTPAASSHHGPAIPEAQVYRKQMLVPFGETIPWVGTWQTIRDLFPHVSFFGRGPGPQVIPIRLPEGRRVTIGPTVCYEDFFPSYSLREAWLGADLLVNASNDGWFGPYMVREFHLAHAVFRSVETRLPQVRAASSGISALILPSGDITEHSDPLARVALVGSVPLGLPGRSLVRIVGLWFAPLALVAAGTVLLGLGLRWWRRRSHE